MKFFKLQATGNDFIVVDARNEYHNWPRLSQLMCRYHFGIGADGVILVQNSPSADLKMSIFQDNRLHLLKSKWGFLCLLLKIFLSISKPVKSLY